MDGIGQTSLDFEIISDQSYLGDFFSHNNGPGRGHLCHSATFLVCLIGFDAWHPSQQLWSCRDGHFTKPHFFLCKLDKAVYVEIIS